MRLYSKRFLSMQFKLDKCNKYIKDSILYLTEQGIYEYDQKYYKHKYNDRNIITHNINNFKYIEDNSILTKEESFQIPTKYKKINLRYEIYTINTNIQLIYAYHNDKLFNVYLETSHNDISTVINNINNMIKI